MGHYASEMMCNTCGQCRCTCPPPPDKTQTQWVVDSTYEALPVPDFDKKYSHYLVGGVKLPSPGLAGALRLGRAHFDTKAQAQAHALKLLNINLAESEAKTESLRARRRELTELVQAPA
jgi:hypothetical protein